MTSVDLVGSSKCYKRDNIPKVWINFNDAYMYHANFYQAYFCNTEFVLAQMINVNMSKTTFVEETNFGNARLGKSNFYMAKFGKGLHKFAYANMTNINSTYGEFNRCTFTRTTLINCYLNNAIIN